MTIYYIPAHYPKARVLILIFYLYVFLLNKIIHLFGHTTVTRSPFPRILLKVNIENAESCIILDNFRHLRIFFRYNQLLFIIFFVYLFKSRHGAFYHFPQNLSGLFWKFSLIIIFFIFSTLALMFFIIPYVLHLYNSHRNFYCNSNIIVIITAPSL